MILIRSNSELEQVFEKIVKAMDKEVKWNGLFVVYNNKLILSGKLRSLVFNFDTCKSAGNLVELDFNEKDAIEISGNEILENALNMTLYAFGKWGQIKGLKVEKDYERLNTLINGILGAVELNAGLTKESFKFYDNGIQLTYEEVIEKILEDTYVPVKEDEEEQGIGLWHKVVWKEEKTKFEKQDLTKQERIKYRLGNNFYMVNYNCPECGEKLYIVIYPVGKEFKIETTKGGVYLSRAYTCRECLSFYTPKPEKLLAEGDVFKLDFDDDIRAYEDYQELIGRNGERTSNCNFNKYESDYIEGNKDETVDLEKIIENEKAIPKKELEKVKEMMEAGFFPEEKVEKYYEKIKQRIENKGSKNKKVKKTKAKKGNKPKKEKAKKVSKVKKVKEKPSKEKVEKTNKIAISEKTRKVLRDLLSDDKDYFIKRMAKLDEEQLENFKNIIDEDTMLKEDERKIYVDTINEILNKKIKHKIDNRVTQAKEKNFKEALKIYKEIEKQEIPEQIKREALENTKETLKKIAESELDYFISKLPEKITKEMYKKIKEKLEYYEKGDIEKYIKHIDDLIDNQEKQEIKTYIKSIDHTNRKSLNKASQELIKKDYEERNLIPFIKEIHDEIEQMDKKSIEIILPDLMEMGFAEALNAYDKIFESDFLPEIKDNTLEKIDRRLKKLKMDECIQLVNKIKKDIQEYSIDNIGIYYNDTTDEKEREIIDNAVKKYAPDIERYEYPILVYSPSLSAKGTKGFILTPEKFYYYNNPISYGSLDVISIDEFFEDKKFIIKLASEEKIKIKNKINKEQSELIAKTISNFINYLKDKPDSRNISYMAQKEHEIKCCYRCGFIYEEGDECPSCGAKINE